MTGDPKKLFLVDGSALAYRSYFAFINNPLTNSKGENTSAPFGFTRSILKVLDEEEPDYMAVIFDTPEPTFRHHTYAEYKATRQKMPDEMAEQLHRIRAIIEGFRIPLLEIPGYEADDVMGTLAKKAANQGFDVYLVTGDKDFMQLVGPHIKIYNPRRSGENVEILDVEGVKAKLGVPPEKVVDVLALMGDVSDNVRGVRGIGEKTAAKLIQDFGSLENLLDHIDEVNRGNLREALKKHQDEALLSKKLVSIQTDAPIELDLEALKVKEPDREKLSALFRELEFTSLLSRFTPTAASYEANRVNYRIVDSKEDFEKLVAELRRVGSFTFDLETTHLDPLRSELVGVAFAWAPGEAYYVPAPKTSEKTAGAFVSTSSAAFKSAHLRRAVGRVPKSKTPSGMGDLFEQASPSRPSGLPVPTPAKSGQESTSGLRSDQDVGYSRRDTFVDLPLTYILDKLKPILEDETIKKSGQNIKYDMLVLSRYGIEVRGVDFDTMVAAYLVNPSGRQHNLDVLSLEYLNYKKIPTKELIGSGKKQIGMHEVPVERVAQYACEDADIAHRLRQVLEPKLKEAQLYDLFEKVEMPLVSVLVEMERSGVALDVDYLTEMSKKLNAELSRLVEQIYELAGERFNINSTQQLGEILFRKLKLPVVRRTKTGFSTDAGVLEELAEKHPMPKALLEYRELAKLKSTYVDALPKLINPETGRLHTSFNQTVTATGRLSSSDPNLQNIPIRTEMGREIRRAFIAGKGHVILDADYSQIELRIMAHLAKDKTLLDAFCREADIHRHTASVVFNVPPEDVTPELRRRAKEINYGIPYGISPYGLATRLGITPEEAQAMIRDYFIKYPGVNDFIIRTLTEARRKGYVTTLLGRRRYLPDLRSENRRIREFAERTAINTPIQGTAADLIKVAMINISRRFKEQHLRAKMVLQVHDELVLEVPDDEIDLVARLVKEEMEEALRLDAPIKVDIGIGPNWLEAAH